MSLLEYFSEEMQHRFTVERLTGTDGFGNPEFDEPAQYRGRVDLTTYSRGTPVIMNEKGLIEQPDAMIICPPLPVGVRDRISVLQPEIDGQFTVYQVQQEFDETGLHHLELSLRRERA